MPASLQIVIARAALIVAAACFVGTVAITVVKLRSTPERESATTGTHGPLRPTASRP